MSDLTLLRGPHNGLQKSKVEEMWEKTLLSPWRDISSRPKKEIRGKLVRLGAILQCEQRGLVLPQTCELDLKILSDVIETLHLGTLIVDDIEDSSQERRGGPTLHLKYGLPVALNLGNLLYFEALQKISRSSLNDIQKLRIYEAIHETMVQGHMGQALDLSIPVDHLDRENVEEVCLKSLDLKSGVLMALALKMGAIAVDEKAQAEQLHHVGVLFGRSLQMLDDCGNLQTQTKSPKNLEDLILRRPSWIWVVLAKEYDAKDWKEFSRVIDFLPEVAQLEKFLVRTELQKKSRDQAVLFLADVLQQFQTQFQLKSCSQALKIAHELGERLSSAYQAQNCHYR